jgi:bacteriorhodopsin
MFKTSKVDKFQVIILIVTAILNLFKDVKEKYYYNVSLVISNIECVHYALTKIHIMICKIRGRDRPRR